MIDHPDERGLPDPPTIRLPEQIQRALDDAVLGMTGCSVLAGDVAIKPVTDWLQDEDHLTNTLCTEDCWLHVVNPHRLTNIAWEFQAAGQSKVEQAASVRRLLALALDGDRELWGVEYPVRIRVPVATSDGERKVLGCQFLTFADSPPVQWDGLFSSDDSYRRWLRSEGYLTTLSDFDVLPLATRAAFISSATPVLPAHPFCCYLASDSAVASIQIPRRRPKSAKLIGHVEWGWGPAHSRSDYLYLSLSSDREHWLIWHEWHDEYGDESRAGAFAKRGHATETETAAALVQCYYRGEQQEFTEIDGPWEVVTAGVLSIVELTRIGEALWPGSTSPRRAGSSRARTSLPRYFAVEEIPPLGEAAWSFESDSLDEAFDQYTSHVTANTESGGGTGLVFLFDRNRHRVVSSTEGGSGEAAVRYWLQ